MALKLALSFSRLRREVAARHRCRPRHLIHHQMLTSFLQGDPQLVEGLADILKTGAAIPLD